ncbi:hypothetical protein [Phnomibacter sp. MR]|jgi:hypothetical protein|uniref:hypothetical protein n=1 Tax=Phnomibacter sp. MR TaxID=3042318 RepID=UPI003A8108E0
MRLLPKHTNNEMRWYLILFLLAALGGAVRKWGTSSGAVSNVILGLQMIVPFLMVYFRSPNCYTPFNQHKILLIYFFYMVFHIIHPLQLTFMHGVFGILVHGGFWLGLFYYFSNRHLFDPRQYMYVFLIVAIIEVVLAFVQYQLPPNHILNKYASDLIEVATVGDRVRVTGTFSFLSGYTAYTMFFALMIWGMIRMRLPQWMIFTAIPAGLIATFMTGSRSGLVIYFLFVGGILFTEYPAGKIFALLGRLIIPAMIFTAVILLYKKIPVFEQAEKAYDNFMARVEANQKSGEQNARFTTDLWYLQNGRFKSPIIGVGLGSTYQGATQLFGTSRSVLEFGYVETEFTRILLEGGVLLLLFKLSLGLIMALNLSFGGFMRWAVWLVVAFAQPIVYNPHNAAFLLLGIILVDNIIWRQKIERKHQWELYQKARQGATQTAATDTAPAPIAIGTTS